MRFEPTDEERAALERIARKARERVAATGAEAIIGGSYAKDTWLPGTQDIDIFARFDVASEPELEEKTRSLINAFPNAEQVMGSRVYLRERINGVHVEIIPIRPLSSTSNTMDHSPDHIEYVNTHLTNQLDVRKLKAILKAQRVYGAESHVRGFSGYVCELLIISFGSLTALADAASKWGPKAHVRFHDEAPGFDEPIIVEDPTEVERNAAAAVSREQLDRFISLMTRLSTGEPVESLLERDGIEGPHAIVRMRSNHEKHDIAAAQLRKIHDRLVRELEPFGVTKSEWEWDEATWTSRIVLESYALEPTTERIGPPVTMKDAVTSFKAEHPEARESHGRMVATVTRDEPRWSDVAHRVCEAPEVDQYETEVA